MTSIRLRLVPSRGRHAKAIPIVLLALAGCGGGDDPVAPAGAANAPPVAAFSAADSVVAGTPIALDASGSSDADGDTLTYSWELGTGQRGGGRQIAALFADPGSQVVRLTVADGRGGSASVERMVTVSAGPAGAGPVTALALVRDSSGGLLSGVTVANVAGGATGSTGADGRASVGAERGVSATLKFSKAGFADQFKAFTLPGSAESGYLEVVMTPRHATATLADATAGGSVAGSDGASVTFEPGSLVDAAGTPVSGAVEVAITPIDVAANVRAFPGRFEGTRTTGQQGLIESYGTAEFILSQGGAAVQLAPGRKATIEIPIYIAKNRDGSAVKAGDVYPLWSLNQRTGTWIEEGSGSVVVAATPSGYALRGEVTHFSWWNHDQFLFPIAKPKPKCLVDTNADGILEDLTGTGHCWHAGTGPEQPTPFAPLGAATERKRRLAEPRTDRIPTWVAEDFTPAAGGKVLPIPADLDITFRSYAKNGTLFGTTVVRLGPDVEQDVPMLLEPVQDNPGTQAIALPFDDRFAVATRGEVDRFTFVAEAGSSYDVVVSRATSSLLGGSARILDVANAPVASGSFGQNGFAAVVTAGAAGTMTVEVTAGDAAPGSYRIEVRKLTGSASNCSNPITLALPSTIATQPIAANGSLCFELPLVANDAVEVSNASQSVARGSIRLFAPSGEQVAIDSYGGTGGAMLLRFGAALSGTYRLQVTNTQPLAGSINGLAVARLAIAGTLAAGGSVAYTEAASTSNARFFLVKPGAASHLAIKIAAGSSNFGATVWPDQQPSFVASGTSARVIRTTPLALPVIETFRQSGQGVWQFTLSALDVAAMPLDSDLVLATPAPDDILVFRIDGSAGQEWSAGISYGPSSGFNPTFAIYAPLLGQLPLLPSNGVYTLPESGPYTVEVKTSTLGSAGVPFKLRVNNAAPPEPLVLSAATERTVTLALGETRRYRFDVVQGQLLALQLASSTTDAQAIVSGGAIHNGFVTLALPATVRNSGARYVDRSETAVLTLLGTSRQEARATGQVTLTVQSPAPIPSQLGVAFGGDSPPSRLLGFGFAIATPGTHLVCLSYVGATGPNGTSAVQGAVWGPSALFSNYTGDLGISGFGTALEVIGELRSGSNTLALMNGLAVPVPVTGSLVALPAPSDLVPGTAAGESLVSCQRRYHRFASVSGTSYTVRVTAQFPGSVRIRKEANAPGNYATRTDTINLGATPLPLVAGSERVVTFTIPTAAPHGSGNYIVEIDGDGDAAGSYTATLSTP